MKRKELILFLLVFFVLLISFYFDIFIVQNVSLLRNSFLDNFFILIIDISSEIIFVVFFTILFLFKKENHRWILPLWVTIGFYAIISFLLKFSIHRLRPYQLDLVSLLPVLQDASHFVWNYSFPSAHSLLVFCVFPLILRQFFKFRFYWLFFVFLVVFSRVYFGLHFLSDVIAGGLIGYFLGVFVIKFEEKFEFGKKFVERFLK